MMRHPRGSRHRARGSGSGRGRGRGRRCCCSRSWRGRRWIYF